MKITKFIICVVVFLSALTQSEAGTINAKTAGLKGDGSTVETALVQKIIDNAASQGDEVYFPAGRYVIDGNIYFPSNIRIYGSTSGVSQIESNGNTVTFIANGKNNVAIENLVFKSVGVDVPSCNNAIIKNNIFYDAKVTDEDYNYVRGSKANGVLIEGNFFFRDVEATPRITCIYLWRGYELNIRKNIIGGKLSYIQDADQIVNNRTWLADNFLNFINAQNINMSDDQGLYRKGIYINGNTGGVNNIHVIGNAVIGSGFISSKADESDYYDHAMYVLTSKQVHIWGNYFTGWPFDSRGALKFRQGSQYSVGRNYCHNVGIIGYRLSNETWEQHLEDWWVYDNKIFMSAEYAGQPHNGWVGGIMYWDKVGSYVEKNYVFWENEFLGDKHNRIQFLGDVTQSNVYYDTTNRYEDGSVVSVWSGPEPSAPGDHTLPSVFNDYKDLPILNLDCLVYGIYCGGNTSLKSVTVSPASLRLFKGETTTLNKYINPSTASNKLVTWSSSDTAIATVNADGKVTAVSEGTATITVTTDERGFTDTSVITVLSPTSSYNLALNKPASQSSDYNASFVASVALNEDTTDFSHTKKEDNPWWQVDLESISDITTIEVYNRADCCKDRLSNFYVFISDTPFSSTDVNATLNQSGVSNYLIPEEAETPTVIDVNRTGRYVRIQLQANNFLNPSEVVVNGITGTLGVKNKSDENEVIIYPNPFNETLTVHLGSHDVRELQLMNIQGQVIFRQTIIPGKSSASISLKRQIQNGMYFLKIIGDTKAETKTLIRGN